MGFGKSIYKYQNYREFLKDAFAALKQENKNFSYRYFSRVAGFKSPSVLIQVIEGQINIPVHNIEKYAKAFKLNKEESFFFHHLVLLNQAKTVSERQIHAEQLIKCRVYRKLHPLSTLQLNYYRHWFYIPIREMVSLKGFREDPEWIAGKLNPRPAPQEVKKALDELIKLGLIERAEDGKLKQASTNVSTGNEVVSQFLSNFHKEMIKKGAESIDRFPRERRDISSVTLGVSSQSIKKIKEMIQKFRKDLLEAATKDSTQNEVYQVNFQIFPLCDKTEGGE